MSDLEPMGTERRMSNAEAVLLTRYAKAACPQQQFDQYTPDAWADLLGDLRYVDAQVALKAVVQRQPFVSPAEIRDEVKRIRKHRLDAFGPMPDPPPEIAGDVTGYRDWYRRVLREICDGSLTQENCPDMPGLVQRIMPDFERMLPSPEPVPKPRIIAEKRKAKDPGYDAGMAATKAELLVRGAAPMPGDELTAADMTEPEPQPEPPEPTAETEETSA